MIEVHAIAQRLLDMLRQHLHAPRDIEFARGVVLESARVVASGLESRVQLLERLGHERRLKTSHRSLIIVIENVLEGLSAGDVGRLHQGQRVLLSAGPPFFSSNKLLHLGDEDVVSLLLDELVFFNLPSDVATDLKTFARVFLDVRFGSVNSALDVERLQFELIDDVGRARLLGLRTEQSQVVHLELVREHAQFLCS